MSYIKVIGCYFLFCLFHSVGASERFKSFLSKITGTFFTKYCWRICYNLISFFLYYHVFFPILAIEARPSFILWSPPYFLVDLISILHLFSILYFILAATQLGVFDYLGIKQLWNGFTILLKKPGWRIAEPNFGSERLEVKGLYSYSRHPILTAGLFILLTSPMNRLNICHIMFFSTYILIGSWFEEKRLIKNFGQDYMDYRNSVPAFIPFLRRKRRTS